MITDKMLSKNVDIDKLKEFEKIIINFNNSDFIFINERYLLYFFR